MRYCLPQPRPAEFLPSLWLNRRPAPRFYPNVVTLSAAHEPAPVLDRIRELARAGLPNGWGVKDSFRALNLAPLGFRVLFEVDWIWRPTDSATLVPSLIGVRWSRVQSERDLAAWEAAWGSAPVQDRLFLPALLADEAVAFLAAHHEGDIIAGAIAYQSDDVVGLSNMFGPQGQGLRVWSGAVAAALEAFPGRPLVGYDSGSDHK